MSNQESNETAFPLAPEFPEAVWLNSDPLTRDDVRGRVTLVFFWDYTNTHCLDSLAYVCAWHAAYEAFGLRVIAVHSPAFEFAQSEPAVQGAVRALNLSFPVVLDNAFKLWEAYENQVWPAFYVLDEQARVVFAESGTSSFSSVEAVLQDLFSELYPAEVLPSPQEPVQPRDVPGMPLHNVTTDFLTGYEFDTLGNDEGYEPHRVVAYNPHRDNMAEGQFYLEGKWLNQRNCVAVAKSHEGSEACMVVPYTASEVNVIVHPAGEVGFSVDVTDQGEPLADDVVGEHIRVVGEGAHRRTQLLVSESKMYRIVKHDRVRSGLLRVYTRSSGFSVYGFTFVSSPLADGSDVDGLVQVMLDGKLKSKTNVAKSKYQRPKPGAAAPGQKAAPVRSSDSPSSSSGSAVAKATEPKSTRAKATAGAAAPISPESERSATETSPAAAESVAPKAPPTAGRSGKPARSKSATAKAPAEQSQPVEASPAASTDAAAAANGVKPANSDSDPARQVAASAATPEAVSTVGPASGDNTANGEAKESASTKSENAKPPAKPKSKAKAKPKPKPKPKPKANTSKSSSKRKSSSRKQGKSKALVVPTDEAAGLLRTKAGKKPRTQAVEG